MKSTFTSAFLFLAWIILYSFHSPSEKAIHIQDAIQQGIISFTATSNGGHSEESVHLQMNNNTDKTIRIKIPAGTTYQPSEDDEQTLIQLNDDVLVLNPKQKRSKNLSAYCTEASDRCPSHESTFAISSTKDVHIKKLIEHLKNNPSNKLDYQDAVWTITDGHSLSNIYRDDLHSKKLRLFLADLTGQENPWYNSPHDYTLNEDRTIRRDVHEIKGELAFSCAPGTTIIEEVCRADGTVMLSHENPNKVPYGTVRYEFKLKTTNWPKGEYYVMIRSTEKDIQKFEFVI